jgi:hypothetical protein
MLTMKPSMIWDFGGYVPEEHSNEGLHGFDGVGYERAAWKEGFTKMEAIYLEAFVTFRSIDIHESDFVEECVERGSSRTVRNDDALGFTIIQPAAFSSTK